MKRTVFVILFGIVALTKASSNNIFNCKEIKERCSCLGCSIKENMVCASNGKTYRNK